MNDDSDSDKDRLIEELRAAIAARDEFIAVAAHELRNPVTPIVAQVQLAQARARREGVSEALMKNLDTLQLAVDHYVRRATTLLETTRVTSGSLRLHPTSFDLVELVRDCVRNYGQLAAHAGSDLDLCAGGAVVGSWDRLALEQVLDNLISNAVRYGDGKPIRVEVREDADQVVIGVIDQGIGIAISDRSRIFERFERAVGNTTRGGFGIGLWLAHKLVQAHGGALEVTSELGRGSKFFVRLPRRTAIETAQ